MAQPAVSKINMNGVNAANGQNQGESQSGTDWPQQEQPQPNVRHIPIFVEGRDEPLLNTDVARSPSDGSGAARQPSPTINEFPKPGSIYNRAKDIPVRTMGQSPGRNASPSRTIPINVVHTSSQKDGTGQPGGFSPNQQRAFDQRQSHEQPQVQRSNSKVHTIPIKIENSQSKRDSSRESARQTSPSMPTVHKSHHNQTPQSTTDQVDSKSARKPHPGVQQSLDAITKIQRIQQDVLTLMGRVEQFKGGSRTNKEYLYLDEMLTQNLLKLDTIDAEGKENIKAARKEAIKCINKCIAVLEAKTDTQASINANAEQPDVKVNDKTKSQYQVEQRNQQEQQGSKGQSQQSFERQPQPMEQ